MNKDELFNKIKTLKKGAYYKALTLKDHDLERDFGGKKKYGEMCNQLGITSLTKVSTLTIRLGVSYLAVTKATTSKPLTPQMEQEYKERVTRPYYAKNTCFTNQNMNTLLECYMGGIGNKTIYLNQDGKDVSAMVKPYKAQKSLSDSRFINLNFDNILCIGKTNEINDMIAKMGW